MSKVNTKRAKLVKAKVKSVKSVKVAKVGETAVKQAKATKVVYDKAKGTLNEVKVAKTEVNVFVYPNKGLGEIDTVRLTINDQNKAFSALNKTHIDIMSLNIHKLVKAVFVELRNANSSKFMFGIKRVYTLGFGLVPKGFNSYKSCITHHINDGKVSLVLNANKHFGMGEIEKALVKVKLSYENHKTYAKLFISEKNLANVVKACQSLAEVSVTE
jgi:hypothetical protein